MTEAGRGGDERGRRIRAARPDPLFGELPPPIEVSSLFDFEDEPAAEPERSPRPGDTAVQARVDPSARGSDRATGRPDRSERAERADRADRSGRPERSDGADRTRGDAREPRPTSDQRSTTRATTRPGDPGPVRRDEPPVVRRDAGAAAAGAAGTVRAPGARTTEVTRPGGPPPRRTAPPPTTSAAAWPSARKAQGGHPLRSAKGRARTVRKIRRVGTIGSLLPWFALPVGLLVLALLLIGVGSFGSDDKASTSTSTSATSSAGGATRSAGSAPSAGSTTALAPASASPSASAPTTSTAAGAPVHLTIEVEDRNRTGRSVRGAVVLGDRTLVPPSDATSLPLHLGADTTSTASLTLLVPQAPQGSHLVCVITASGAVTGSMTREMDNGVLDCSTAVQDIATGGT